LREYLESAGPSRKVVAYRRGQIVFSQGDSAAVIKYIQKGVIKLSVLSRIGKEAVIAILGPGDFFGEGVLTGQALRIETATAMVPTTVFTIARDEMIRLLREEPTFSARFIKHMLARNMRIEADLIDQLFNSSEKRLARTLLLMARYGEGRAEATLPKISQEMLAEMVGTTRGRVNYFMNKFRRLGLIDYNGSITINRSLLGLVLHA
jgi:CRP-like cAMP-binding protein